MKTITLTIAILFCCLVNKSQTENSHLCSANDRIENHISVFQGKLSPVYFNFHKRQLRDLEKNMISPVQFLDLCRHINDSAVQMQIARYDSFTRDKKRLGVVAIGSGFAAMGLIGSGTESSGQGNVLISESFIFLGVIGFLAIPAIAIYSSVPHQKRKSVLFRDLPIAYNKYVESIP